MKLPALLKKLFAPRDDRRAGPDTPATSPEDEDDDTDPFNPFPEPVTLEITDVFDLHSIPPRDVKRVVVEYLAQAHQSGFTRVRIIHGKGIGAQRQLVRAILADTPFVQHFADAPPEAGGWGATVVQLSRDG
jgi:dsDNA-specific endonuclease/ATPase MutS2